MRLNSKAVSEKAEEMFNAGKKKLDAWCKRNGDNARYLDSWMALAPRMIHGWKLVAQWHLKEIEKLK